MLKDPRPGIIAVLAAAIVGTLSTLLYLHEGLILLLVVLAFVGAWRMAVRRLAPLPPEDYLVFDPTEADSYDVDDPYDFFGDAAGIEEDFDDGWVEVPASGRIDVD